MGRPSALALRRQIIRSKQRAIEKDWPTNWSLYHAVADRLDEAAEAGRKVSDERRAAEQRRRHPTPLHLSQGA